MNPCIKLLGITDIMSGSEEKTPTVSPDQGATGETTTSSKNKESGMQTSLSEKEKEAHYKKAYDDAVTKLWGNIYMQDPETGWDILIEALYKQFARENKAKRSKEEIFLELDRLEALETEHLETSGCVPDWLKEDMMVVGKLEEFESYLKLLSETRDHFGHGVECMVI